MEIDLLQARDRVISIAKEVGKYQLDMSAKIYGIEDKGGYNPVTEADKESERRIVSRILEYYPDHNIIGEEHEYKQTPSPYKWYIDPIDGTVNFMKNIPMWSISIGLVLNDKPIMGVVYLPYLGDTYHAMAGGGAFKNSKMIHVSKHDTLEGGLYATGFYYDHGNKMVQTLAATQEVLSAKTLGIRRIGTASIDMCLVAQGSFDVYFEHKLSTYDFMAAYTIVQEAGGLVTDFQGNPKNLENGEILVSNKPLHQEFVRLTQKHFHN